MELILYSNFSKRKNSTKRPSGAGTTYDVKLKQGCAVEKPVFLIDGITLTYNYAKWNDAYYFIDDIIIGNNYIYELHCSMDVLATWKSVIGSYTAFIERAASDYDLMINDRLITSKQEIVDVTRQTKSPGMFSSTGCYIIPCMNSYGLQIFASPDLDAFAPLFYPSTYQVSDFSAWLQAGIASIGDYAQYFGKVIWIPYNLSSIVSPNKTRYISVGCLSWDLGAGNEIWILDPETVVSSLGVTYFDHFAGYYNDFRDSSPMWSSYQLYIPGVGQITLDPLKCNDPDRYIYLYYYFAPATGSFVCDLRLMKQDGTSVGNIGHYVGNLGADVPYGIASNDISRVMQPITSGLGGALANGAMNNYLGAAASAVGGVLESVRTDMTPDVQLIGGSGALADVKNHRDFVMTRILYDSAGVPLASAGRPLYQYRQISTLSGYVKCIGASLDTAAMGEEKDELNNYLNSGFYYE